GGTRPDRVVGQADPRRHGGRDEQPDQRGEPQEPPERHGRHGTGASCRRGARRRGTLPDAERMVEILVVLALALAAGAAVYRLSLFLTGEREASPSPRGSGFLPGERLLPAASGTADLPPGY